MQPCPYCQCYPHCSLLADARQASTRSTDTCYCVPLSLVKSSCPRLVPKFSPRQILLMASALLRAPKNPQLADPSHSLDVSACSLDIVVVLCCCVGSPSSRHSLLSTFAREAKADRRRSSLAPRRRSLVDDAMFPCVEDFCRRIYIVRRKMTM